MKNQDKLMWLIAGTALGATAMWVFDPHQGARRRAHMRDKAHRLSNDTYDAALRALKRTKHRLIGVYARSLHQADTNVDDNKLTNRVRSEFGRKLRHARSVESKVVDGVVTLSGPVLKEEVKPLLDCVRQVPGVKRVINMLEIHEATQSVAALQGRGKAYLQ